MANTETKVDLVINRLSQAKYEQLKSAGQLEPNQLYLTTDSIEPVPETRKINNKTLDADIYLTGADIAVSTTDSTKINQSLQTKIEKPTSGTFTPGNFAKFDSNGNVVDSDYDSGDFLVAVPSSYKTYADTKSSLSSDGYATQAQLDTKSAISVDNEHADANILHVSQEEYNQLVVDDEVLSNAIYVISSDYIEAYGQQIKNVASPTDLSDAATKEYVDNAVGQTGNLNYALSTAVGVLSSGSYVYDIADRTITTIGINQSSTPVIVRLPPAKDGARDFILRVEISSSSAPTFTFTSTTGLDFESDDSDWAVMETGVNLVSFTETKR